MNTQNIGHLFNIQQMRHFSEQLSVSIMTLCIISGQSRYDKFSACCYHSLPLCLSLSLSGLIYSLESSVLILSCVSFSHHSIILLCILLPQICLCHWILTASVVHILVLTHVSFSFPHFCMQVTMAVGEEAAAHRYRREQKKKKDKKGTQ